MRKEVVVIKTVEDSVPVLDRRLIQAYLRTVYRLVEPRFDVRIGRPNPALDRWLNQSGWGTYAFITACNPGSVLLPDAENKRRQDALFRALCAQGMQVPLPAVHIGAGGDWPPEASWWIPELAAETAVALARQFGQNALVFGQKDAAAVLWWIR